MMHIAPASGPRVDRNVVDRRYALRREIGRGGCCVVHEAVHQITRRVVAVKRLQEGLRQDPTMRARLFREAEVIAAVSHPNVVAILDAGEELDGSPYVVLEYLEARSLEGFVAARGPLPLLDALTLVKQACAAVGAVHEAGFVHRDVKPGNMLLEAKGATYASLKDAQLKLIDFGLASAPWFDAQGPKLTRPDIVVGTPEYMPLERLAGNPDASTPAVDVYSLGATLFECLTGRAPFDGDVNSVLAKALTQPAPSVKTFRRDTPDLVAAVVDTALSRDASRRYRDARVMEHALGVAIEELTKKPTVAPPAEGASRRKFVRAPYITPVRVEHAGGVLDGRTEDLSMGGMMAMLPEPLPTGSVATVRFALPTTGAYVRAQAVVRWSRKQEARTRTPCAVGLEFRDLEPAIRDAIDQFVRIVGQEVERRG